MSATATDRCATCGKPLWWVGRNNPGGQGYWVCDDGHEMTAANEHRRANEVVAYGDMGRCEAAYLQLIADAEGSADRDGVLDTPQRATRAWRELTRGYRDPAPELRTFEAEHDEVVVVAPIPFYSLCEHHLLPFHGRAYIAYLPEKRILGLSKFARVVNHFARRLQVQERLTTQIADYLEPLGAGGLAVVCKAEHLCMAMRGAQVPGAITTTSVMRGAFRDKPEARSEVLGLMGVAK